MSDNTTLASRFAAANAKLPLVAILRGIKPEEAEAIGRGLYDAGFRLIEVPLNSPDPFSSIAKIRAALPADALVGAGTVLTLEQVAQLKACGGDLSVMPHAALADYLSGLLIGHELVSGLQHAQDNTPLVLIGDPALCERYVRSLNTLGQVDCTLLDNTAPAGLWDLACAAGLLV